jgi:hypothetical protein
MPWLRQSDTAANHPIVLSALELDDADDRILNELFGYMARCATQSAAYEQDYIVTVGTARALAGSITRYTELAAAAKRCGYWTETTVDVDGQQRAAWKLVEDEDLFHMILKADRAWTNKRKKDSRDTALTVPVRLRDGDACRYCGKTVSWRDHKTGRGGTYDHVRAGSAATPETYVVCCRECNGRRQDDPDNRWRLLPAPADPLYGPDTVDFLARNGVDVEPTYTRPAAPAAPAAVEPSEATEQYPAEEAAQATEQYPASRAATEQYPAATSGQESRSDLGQRSPGSVRVGTGRDWTGLDWEGSEGAGWDGSADQPRASPPVIKRSRPRRTRRR